MSAILLSAPLMVANLVISGLVIMLTMPEILDQLPVLSGSFSISIYLLDIVVLAVFLALLLFVHEFLHLVLIPGFIKSDKTCVGVTYAGPFVATGEVLTRRRFMIISITPFIVLSILLPLIAGLAGMLSPLLIAIVLLNALGASVDMLSMLLVLTQVPPGSEIVCNGMNTYWKSVPAAATPFSSDTL